ncbi:MAG: nucleotide sugar dehydrogenase [Deltaproteobacteria bacterium]|nr:nucleotide sugar dehydrogenase [Deltaproteobacteria bacterium]
MVNYRSLQNREDRIAIIGLGYVGLPLAVHLSRHFKVVGFDLNLERIEELKSGKDRTLEVSEEELAEIEMQFTALQADISLCRLIIVAVPTPIDEYRIPDLGPVKNAAIAAGRQMKKGACVVFESTVYPGVTEDVCVPILEKESGLKFGKEFTVGYSPERINPGDKVHTLDKIVKIVSGSDDDTTDLLCDVYGKIVTAGIHRASSIKVAEAAKVIENTQRDLNIALMNELALIFDKMGIDTTEVLEASGTKWNFLPFRPGLVGGHCIGVDPYYLTFKAESMGYHPEIILAGRRINDSMGKYVAERMVKLLINAEKKVHNSKVAFLGITFKEDVPDLRNTKAIDIIKELEDYGVKVLVHDPLADKNEAQEYYGIELQDQSVLQDVDAVIIAVAHSDYKHIGLSGIANMCGGGDSIVVDVKGLFKPSGREAGKITYWRL